jgi:hypothetical protein
MERKPDQPPSIQSRTYSFALRVITVVAALTKGMAGQEVGRRRPHPASCTLTSPVLHG